MSDIETALSEELLALQDFAAQQGPSIINVLAAAELPESLRPQEEEVEAFAQVVFRDGVVMLLEQWENLKLSQQSTSGAELSVDNGTDSGHQSIDTTPGVAKFSPIAGSVFPIDWDLYSSMFPPNQSDYFGDWMIDDPVAIYGSGAVDCTTELDGTIIALPPK